MLPREYPIKVLSEKKLGFTIPDQYDDKNIFICIVFDSYIRFCNELHIKKLYNLISQEIDKIKIMYKNGNIDLENLKFLNRIFKTKNPISDLNYYRRLLIRKLGVSCIELSHNKKIDLRKLNNLDFNQKKVLFFYEDSIDLVLESNLSNYLEIEKMNNRNYAKLN